MNEVNKIVREKILRELEKEFFIRLQASIIVAQALKSTEPFKKFIEWVRWCNGFLSDSDRAHFIEFLKNRRSHERK